MKITDLTPMSKHCVGMVLLVSALAGSVTLVMTGNALAEGWSGSIDGGTVASSSGSRTRLRLTLSNGGRPFSQQVYAEWLTGGSDNNAYILGYNPRYWFKERYYIFGEGRFRIDESINIDRDIYLLTGIGGQFFKSESQRVVLESGLGVQILDRDSEEGEQIGPLGLLRLGYDRVLSDLLIMDLAVSAARSEDISELNAEVGLSMRIPTGAIRVSYRTQSIAVGDDDRVSDNDTYISFTYGF